MSNRHISREFLAKAGERELEIFLLRDEARRDLAKMHQRSTKEVVALEIEQQRRREEDIRQAKLDLLAERAKLELTPKWQPEQKKVLKEADLQAAAEHRVESRNTAEINAMLHQQRERENAFLAQQKEERLLRDATDTRELQSAPARLLNLKRDFDRER